MEIEQKSQFSSQQIQVVKAQMASKARENRMLQLTASEVSALPKETHVYEGVGKMYVRFSTHRFQPLVNLTSSSWQLDHEEILLMS
jgi:chaperonin cofactor prefoldin